MSGIGWTTPDPLADKYDSVSPYAFCNNNPVNFIDPDAAGIGFDLVCAVVPGLSAGVGVTKTVTTTTVNVVDGAADAVSTTKVAGNVGEARNTIPDSITSDTVYEIKDVQNLSNTKQIQAQINYAKRMD